MKRIIAAAIGALALIAFGTTFADATPIQTIHITGNMDYGYDSSSQFGPAGDLGNKAYTLDVSYDPTALKNDTCPAPNNSCQWNFGSSGVTEKLTIGAITKSYVITSGTIQFCACSADAVYINANGAAGGFNLSFLGGGALFLSQTNVNNPELLKNVSNLAVTNPNFGTYGLGGATSMGDNNFTAISTSLVTSTAVPEPLTISIFGAGLVGAAAMRRRKKA